ncbi:expressed unknown protein [Seminavis robusta]|uniref:Uncharacterized protein n=1 Tax=Seminavis robusta TaxID=568900 RepID=A0A9N8DS78_9STRA|nr:expressed unknown protein [Seminavis robusta]|eukprot:Sro304_g112620.1 n/a (217) ;mRNA; r:50441-51091
MKLLPKGSNFHKGLRGLDEDEDENENEDDEDDEDNKKSESEVENMVDGNCYDKLVRIKRINIAGGRWIDKLGPWAEVILHLNGRPHWPDGKGCGWSDQSYTWGGRYYCYVPNGGSTAIKKDTVEWEQAGSGDYLSSSVTELDDWQDDAYGVEAPPSKWFSSTCKNYDVMLTFDYAARRQSESCISGKAALEAGQGATASLEASYESCETASLPTQG